MIQILFAILAGVLTIGAPCILPLLPILLGSSVGQSSKTRPLFIVGGFILVFSIFGIFLSFITTHLGIDPNTIRTISIFMLGIFGLLMIWPKPFELLTIQLNKVINKANQIGQSRGGNFGGFLLGMMLGIIWTPCAGPVLGAILTLIATQGNTARAIVLLISYAVGAGIPMLVIAYGSQYISTKVRVISQYSTRLQQIFGVLIMLLAVAMYFQYDTLIQTKLTQYFPTTAGLEKRITLGGTKEKTSSAEQQNGLTTKMGKTEFKNLGKAPEFTDIFHWINSDPLTIAELKGKVVLIDFWTYSCINCVRTLTHLTNWYDTYKDQGFVIIGVHTPEFAFEKVTSNVETSMKRFNIHYPVAQDNDFKTWEAYSNQFWPAEYLIDQQGNIVYTHFGEGNYDKTENAIRELLKLNGEVGKTNSAPAGTVNSPEMYFGFSRLQYLTPEQKFSEIPKDYTLPNSLKLNNFALEGNWNFSAEKTTLLKPGGKIKLKFNSGKLYMVAESPRKTTTLKIFVDGKKQSDVLVSMSDLYTLFNSTDYGEHTVEIELPDSGFEAFTFTFG